MICKYGGNSGIVTKCGVPNISIAALYENGELRLKLSFLVIVGQICADFRSNCSLSVESTKLLVKIALIMVKNM